MNKFEPAPEKFSEIRWHYTTLEKLDDILYSDELLPTFVIGTVPYAIWFSSNPEMDQSVKVKSPDIRIGVSPAVANMSWQEFRKMFPAEVSSYCDGLERGYDHHNWYVSLHHVGREKWLRVQGLLCGVWTDINLPDRPNLAVRFWRRLRQGSRFRTRVG